MSNQQNSLVDEEELKRQFAIEFGKLYGSGEKIQVELTPLEAWSVMGNLQLALRHSANVGPTAKLVKKVAKRIQRAVAPDGALAEVAARGWNPVHDQPQGEKQ